jgi:ankyrin repeat protein
LALIPFLGKLSPQKNLSQESLSIISSLLPNSAFHQEPCATGIALGQVEKLGSLQLLNIVTFLISNNFPGETSDEKLYEWFIQSGPAVLRTVASTKGTTAEALREKLFRLAVEAEDVPKVKLLIKAGVDPNGHVCRHSRIPDTMNPFQFACIRGNTELVHVLIEAGSSIDQPGHGWKSSGLVLAILGEYRRGSEYFWSPETEKYTESRWNYNPTEEDEDHLDNNVDDEEKAALFLALVRSLIEAGAAINPVVDESSLENLSGRKDSKSGFDEALSSVMQEWHSPLTVASKYRNQELVDMFLQKGADVNFLTKQGCSALQECLYSREERELDGGEVSTPRALSERKPLFPGAESVSRVISVAHSLLSAGADVDGHVGWCYWLDHWEDDSQNDDEHYGHYYRDHGEGCYWTTLDLGVLTESLAIVRMIIRAGSSRATRHSLEQAIAMEYFELIEVLLDLRAPLSSDALGHIIRRDRSGKNIKALLKVRSDTTTQRMILFHAIRAGDNPTIEYVFEFGASDSRRLLQNFDRLDQALNDCCNLRQTDTLRFLIDKFSMCNVSISLYLGDALRSAVYRGYDDIVDMLLSAGADINDMSRFGETALMKAIEKKDRKAVLKLLGADPILNTETVLHGCDEKSTSSCVNQHDVCGDALITATKWGDDFVVEKLLNAGASIDAMGKANGYRHWDRCTCITPLTAAIMESNIPLINTLMSNGAAVNNPPGSVSSSMTRLAAALTNRQLGVVNFLVQRGANPYDSLALKEATNDFRLLQILLTAFGSCDIPDGSEDVGHKALVKAMEAQDQNTTMALLDGLLRYIKPIDRLLSWTLIKALKHDTTVNHPIVRMVLDCGANPNAVLEIDNGTFGTYLGTSLCVAIDKKSQSKVQMLLDAGGNADVNLIGMHESPMQSAVYMNMHDTVRILLENGSDPNAVPLLPRKGRYTRYTYDRDTGTPLQIAVRRQDTETIRLLLQYKANTNAIFGNMHHTPLQMASRDGSKEIVELLLEHGADVNAPLAREFGATALQFAAIKGLLGIAYLLLQYDADVNAPAAEIDGRTALEGAAEHGRIDMVQLLLNSGANIFQDGQEQYENAVRRASENGHHAVRRLLESYHG